MIIPTLQTSRLQLEPLSRRHSQGMFEMWSSPEVCEYSGPALDLAGKLIQLPALDPRDSDKILEFFLHHGREGTGFRWAMRHRELEHFVGAVGFNKLGTCCEIAYHMHPKYWGNGFMSEACRAALGWAFAGLGASSVEAYIEAENVRSIRLAEALGLAGTEGSKCGALRYSIDSTPRARGKR